MCIRLDKIFNFLHFPQFILCQDATITGAGTSDVTLARDSLSGMGQHAAAAGAR